MTYYCWKHLMRNLEIILKYGSFNLLITHGGIDSFKLFLLFCAELFSKL